MRHAQRKPTAAPRAAPAAQLAASSHRPGRLSATPRWAQGNRPMIQRQTAPQPTLGEGSETTMQRCYTCSLPGGIGICCYRNNPPIVPECLDLGKRIIDECPPGQSCIQQAQCAQCRCIGERLGEQYCQCTGIV